MCCGGSNDETEKQRQDIYAKADLRDPGYTGEKMDDRIRNGPLEERHCTDCICCLIFVGYLVLMCFIA